MVHLTDDPVTRAADFAAAGISLPDFDQTAMAGSAPSWLHIGPGNLFRALHAVLAQGLLDRGALPGGVAVAETLRPKLIHDVYRRHSNRHLCVVAPASGPLDKELIASVASSYVARPDHRADWDALLGLVANPALQMITLSITEKGHGVGPLADRAVVAGGPGTPANAMGVLASLLVARQAAGGVPVAVVSTDNFRHNGDRLRSAVLTVADAWSAGGAVPAGFPGWLRDPSRVAFPLTMIDRITPNPSPAIAAALARQGFEDTELLPLSPGTVVAPFANTEPDWHLVVEDSFPGGRPPLEAVGVRFATRATVEAADEMKVTACLNPIHTALALFGVLLGYDDIATEMADADIAALVRRLGYDEALPVCGNPEVLDPKTFLDEVVERRLPNHNLHDTPQPIAADTSEKLPIRFGATIEKHLRRGGALVATPLVLAAWLRYLLGVDDRGEPMELSPDPIMPRLRASLEDTVLGAVTPGQAAKAARLATCVIGVDLAASGMEAQVARQFESLAAGPGAVRAALQSLREETRR
jgi:fructuronate reductase